MHSTRKHHATTLAATVTLTWAKPANTKYASHTLGRHGVFGLVMFIIDSEVAILVICLTEPG